MANADVKEAVLAALKVCGTTTAPTHHGLQAALGLERLNGEELSFTQFWKAVRSLYYKPGLRSLRLNRRWCEELKQRVWDVAPLAAN